MAARSPGSAPTSSLTCRVAGCRRHDRTVVFDSYADAVDETYDPSQDGDDADDPYERRSLFARAASPFAPLKATLSKVPTASIVVPYVQVGEGSHDSDAVYGIKRAYARSVSGFRLRMLMRKPLEVRRSWGPAFSDEFGQHVYSKSRHALLGPYFDAFAISLMHTPQPTVSARDKQIALQLGWHTALYNRRMSVLYSQLRPSQLGPAQWITRADCSGIGGRGMQVGCDSAYGGLALHQHLESDRIRASC